MVRTIQRPINVSVISETMRSKRSIVLGKGCEESLIGFYSSSCMLCVCVCVRSCVCGCVGVSVCVWVCGCVRACVNYLF